MKLWVKVVATRVNTLSETYLDAMAWERQATAENSPAIMIIDPRGGSKQSLRFVLGPRMQQALGSGAEASTPLRKSVTQNNIMDFLFDASEPHPGWERPTVRSFDPGKASQILSDHIYTIPGFETASVSVRPLRESAIVTTGKDEPSAGRFTPCVIELIPQSEALSFKNGNFALRTDIPIIGYSRTLLKANVAGMDGWDCLIAPYDGEIRTVWQPVMEHFFKMVKGKRNPVILMCGGSTLIHLAWQNVLEQFSEWGTVPFRSPRVFLNSLSNKSASPIDGRNPAFILADESFLPMMREIRIGLTASRLDLLRNSLK